MMQKKTRHKISKKKSVCQSCMYELHSNARYVSGRKSGNNFGISSKLEFKTFIKASYNFLKICKRKKCSLTSFINSIVCFVSTIQNLIFDRKLAQQSKELLFIFTYYFRKKIEYFFPKFHSDEILALVI